MNPWHLLVAGLPVLLVLVGSARSSTRRSTRFSVLQAIQSGTASPASRSRLARAIARAPLPVPLALGLKDLLGRRHRALRLGWAIAVTGAAVVFALSMQASLDALPAGEVSDVPDELPVLVYTLDAVLLVITVTTLVAIALLSVRERIRDYGVLKTIGLTPRQITSSLVSAHTALALIAALLSIPAGIGLYLVRLRDRRGRQRGSSDRPVVVARPRAHRNPAHRRGRHQPAGPPRDPDPDRRRPPLRMRTTATTWQCQSGWMFWLRRKKLVGS